MHRLNKVVEDLRGGLQEIESKLTWDDLPMVALEEFKMTVDSVRTSLLAFLSAPDPADYGSSLRRLRLRRAAQVCHGVLADVVDGTVNADTPGFAEFLTTAGETLEQVERLVGRGA